MAVRLEPISKDSKSYRSDANMYSGSDAEHVRRSYVTPKCEVCHHHFGHVENVYIGEVRDGLFSREPPLNKRRGA